MGDDENLASQVNDAVGEEEEESGGTLRKLISGKGLPIIIGVGVVFFFVFLFFIFRGPNQANFNYIPIAENLSVESATAIRKELSNESMPSRMSGSGKNFQVEVPVRFRNESLEVLARRSLPAGYIKGFDLFDEEEGLGSTDFDKRIKLMRAKQGELVLGIIRMEAIQDARVQLVMPEKQLFSRQQAQESASVLVKLKEGAELDKAQVLGIAYYVAYSVEGLNPENVTIVNTQGYILHGPPTELSTDLEEQMALITGAIEDTGSDEDVPRAETGRLVTPTPNETTNLATGPTALEIQEQVLQQLNLEERLNNYRYAKERQLTKTTHQILAHYLPTESYRVQVSLAMPPVSRAVVMRGNLTDIEKMSILILVDSENEQVTLRQTLKKDIFKAVAAATGYRYNSADRIELRKTVYWDDISTENYQSLYSTDNQESPATSNAGLEWLNLNPWGWLKTIFTPPYVYYLGVLFIFLFFLYVVRRVRSSKEQRLVDEFDSNFFGEGRKEATDNQEAPESAAVDSEELADIKESVKNNPQQIADLIKNWLEDEK